MPFVQIVDQGEDFVGGSFDHKTSFNVESVRLSEGKDEETYDCDDNDDPDCEKHKKALDYQYELWCAV